jgi:hypothetical protein
MAKLCAKAPLAIVTALPVNVAPAGNVGVRVPGVRVELRPDRIAAMVLAKEPLDTVDELPVKAAVTTPAVDMNSKFTALELGGVYAGSVMNAILAAL